MEKVVGVNIIYGKAYINIAARTDDGLHVDVEPVFRAVLTVDDLVKALQQAVAFDERSVRLPKTGDEWQKYHKKNPVLAAIGVKNDKKLAKDGASYTISWDEGEVIVYLHELDKKGRFAYGIGRHITFPADTSLRTLAEAILDDVHKLPELGYVDVTQPK